MVNDSILSWGRHYCHLFWINGQSNLLKDVWSGFGYRVARFHLLIPGRLLTSTIAVTPFMQAKDPLDMITECIILLFPGCLDPLDLILCWQDGGRGIVTFFGCLWFSRANKAPRKLRIASKPFLFRDLEGRHFYFSLSENT